MPHLRSICLSINCRELHAIDWGPFVAILSTPQLREFTLSQYLLSPRCTPTESDIDSIAPITSFRYDQYGSRWKLFDYPTQEETLALVLKRLRATLENLVLPMELASLRVLSDSPSRWPRLRILYLRGVFCADPSRHVPFVSALSEMPNLRVLNLELALPSGVDSQLLHLWPRGHTRALRLPWEDLEDLTVSFPHHDDQIYAHLPRSLRRLSLRCSPHYCMHLWHCSECDLYFQHPIRCASEMLEILTSVNAPRLHHLQLEYLTDAADDKLLRCIVERFPNLTSLEIHRYPQPDDKDIPVVSPRFTHFCRTSQSDDGDMPY